MADLLAASTYVSQPPRTHWREIKRTRIVQTLASIRIGVTLLILIAMAMAVATIYEARHTRSEAQALFYQSAWFNGLLAALFINILAITLTRWPVTWRRFGFAVTHLGVLVVLGSALTTSRFGLEGQLRLVEQETTDRLTTADWVIAAESTGATVRTSEFPVPLNPFHPKRGLPRLIRAPGADIDLVVHDLLPNATWQRGYRRAEAGPPAMELSVLPDRHAEPLRYWVAPSAGSLTIGTLRVELLAAGSQANADALVQATGTSGTLHVTVADRNIPYDIEVVRNAPAPIGSTGLTLVITGYYPDAVVGEGRRLQTRSPQPNNPAIEFEIRGPKGAERRLAFARYPEFSRMHTRQSLYPAVETHYEFTAGDGDSVLRFGLAAGRLRYRLVDEDGNAHTGEAVPGQPLSEPALGLNLTVASLLEHAQPLDEPVPVTSDGSNDEPAARIAIRVGGSSREAWLGFQRPTVVALDGHSYRLTFRHREHRLPFAIRLDRFDRQTYPGTDQAAMFASHVTLTDPATGATHLETIQMNQPLRVAGYTFFQSGFERLGTRNASILTVSRDPGRWGVYIGFTLVSVGAIWMALAKRPGRAAPAAGPLIDVRGASPHRGLIPAGSLRHAKKE